MKVYPNQSSGCLTVSVSASAGAVDRRTYRKWVWTFINVIANLVNVVVSNHNVRMAQILVFLMMIHWCDSATRPILASIRKCKKMIGKLLSTPVLPPPPPLPSQLQIDFKSNL